MAAIEFDALITNGTIEIPASQRDQLSGPVHVIVLSQCQVANRSKIDELLAHPLSASAFKPLTRQQANERT
jgi:hypothetical protein